MHRSSKFQDEIIFVLLVSLSIFISIYFDLFDLFHDYTREYEDLEIDEWFIALLPISAITIWYALRKIHKNNILAQEVINTSQKDTITSLPNRAAFRKTYKEHQNLDDFLFLINVINFKDINHSFGINVGDQAIRTIALKLQNIVQELTQKTLFRVYGDEFAFFCQSDLKHAQTLAYTIKNSFEKESINIDNTIDIQIDIAISFSNTQPKFQTALIAMQTLKQSTDTSILLYEKDKDYQQRSSKNLKTLKLLKEAKEHNLFTPVYQPIVDNKTKEFSKYETLIRIQKDDTMIYPNEFLELSKKYKYYDLITKAVIEKSFQVFQNRKEKFSINLSSMDINNESILEYLFTTMNENKETASRMIVELVESENIDFTQKVISFRDKIKSYGVELAIDDFGSGYSNMINILQLQPDYIKIDGSLIEGLQTDMQNYSFVEAIVSFAQKNNIKTIAEFVSTKEIFETVQKLGIDFSQGYYFAKPQLKPY